MIEALIIGWLMLPLDAFYVTNTPFISRFPVKQATLKHTHVSQNTANMVVSSSTEVRPDSTPANLPSLPPRQNMTDLEYEFRQKLSTIVNACTVDRIAAIPHPRSKILYEGVIASANDPFVYRSFEVLFQDLLPLRVAGRVLFAWLTSSLEKQWKRRQHLLSQILNSPSTTTNVSQINSQLNECQLILEAMVGSDHNPVTGEQVQILFETIQGLTNQTWDRTYDHPPKGKEKKIKSIPQDEILIRLFEFTDTPSNILQQVHEQSQSLSMRQKRRETAKQQKAQQYEDRYNDMLHSFASWQSQVSIPNSTIELEARASSPQEQRKWDVLRGCFVGAKNPKVVEALCVVYVDYPALRLAGDLIFQLVSTLIVNIR
jgi:hypothetical protein